MAFDEHIYLNKLAILFKSEGDKIIALQQSNYLKNHFPFFGLKADKRRGIMKVHIKENGIPPFEFLEKTVKAAYLFEEREMHYFAVELLDKHKKILLYDHIFLAEWLVTHKSWWDTVDLLASHIVGMLCINHPSLISKTENWIQNENMWLRRSALLYQLGYKDKTDEERLFKYCNTLANEKEFFIRKAIGWVLRQYAKYNPDSVKKFVSENYLSPLSRREALKNL